MKISSGFVIIQDNKILLIHPTNSDWYGTFSIPKGHVEKDENILKAAIRETQEEIGILVNENDIVSGPHCINYIKNNNIYKKVYYFVINPSKKINPKDFTLQKEEVSWAGFCCKEDAQKRIFHRLKDVLNYLK